MLRRPGDENWRAVRFEIQQISAFRLGYGRRNRVERRVVFREIGERLVIELVEIVAIGIGNQFASFATRLQEWIESVIIADDLFESRPFDDIRKSVVELGRTQCQQTADYRVVVGFLSKNANSLKLRRILKKTKNGYLPLFERNPGAMGTSDDADRWMSSESGYKRRRFLYIHDVGGAAFST